MSCSPFELKDYFLKELPAPQALQVEGHLKTCAACTEELERLRLTEAALFSLRDEEIPQRIGFVSDKIFEPSPVRRWLAAFWGSAGRLGFASAAMLSAAIVFSSVNKPVQAPVAKPVDIRTVSTGPSPEEIQRQIDQAVAKAVDNAVTQSAKTQQVVADLRKSYDETRVLLVRASEELDYIQRRNRGLQRASLSLPPESGEGK